MDKELSDAWTGFTRFVLLKKATRRIHMVRVETYKKTHNFSPRQSMARYEEVYVRCSEKESKTKMGNRELGGIFSLSRVPMLAAMLCKIPTMCSG